MPDNLKAFAVQEHDECTGGILFARHNIEARKWGANEWGGGELTAVSCRRAPWADQYAPGPVPLEAMLEHGWWRSCISCSRQLYEESPRWSSKGGDLYCSPFEWLSDCERRARIEARKDAAWAAAVDLFGPAIERRYVADRGRDGMCVDFGFPGGSDSARWIVGSGTVSTTRRDVEVWNAWRARVKAAANA